MALAKRTSPTEEDLALSTLLLREINGHEPGLPARRLLADEEIDTESLSGGNTGSRLFGLCDLAGGTDGRLAATLSHGKARLDRWEGL